MRRVAIKNKQNRVLGLVAAITVCGALTAAADATPASAAAGAWWHLVSDSFPTQMQPGSTEHLIVAAVNRGYEAASGASAPIVLTDKLPAGVEVTGVDGRATPKFSLYKPPELPAPQCSFTAHEAICSYAGTVKSYARLWMLLTVKVAAQPAASEVSDVSVVGGEVPRAAIESALDLAGGETKYGLDHHELAPEDVGGGLTTQAGTHPFQLTTTLGFDKTERVPFYSENQSAPLEPQLPREVNVKLPPGLIGNPTPFPECTGAQFGAADGYRSNGCPQDSAVGYANILIDEQRILGLTVISVPVFNLVPDNGEPAKFGFTVERAPVYLDTSVRTGGDYGVTVHVGNIPELVTLLESEVTFWGVPGDQRHDNSRGWYCGISEDTKYGTQPCKLEEDRHPKPLLVMPTSCTGELPASVETDSWKEPSNVLSYGLPMPALDGCNHLDFEPKVSLTPDSQQGSTASGLDVDVHVPQDESLVPTGRSEANVKDTTVALPEGLVLNPSAADGLLSCSLDEISLDSAAQPSCPEASKVGTVTIRTPLLPDPLTGAAYLATQDANPFGSLVALYVVAEDPKAGVLVKLAGEVKMSATGQITSRFTETPQLPFEDFELNFFGGARAPLATPASCGSYTTQATIAPWSGTTPISSSSTFFITSGPNGSSCSSQLGFAPTLTGGTLSVQAGEFSPLTTTMSRNDGEQPLQSVKLKLPPGLMGSLTGVELCPEANANAGTCGPNSLIGHTVVSVGIGGDPYSVTGGRVYMTGPYQGAPFGLSIVEPAVAGPFNLGTVVVRAKVEVDPHTAQLTVTTDPSGPYAIPQILDGIPLQIRHVNVTVDRKDFTFNATSCEKLQIEGTLGSSEGVQASLPVPFQVANCARLAFKPTLKSSSSAKTSRRKGAELVTTVTYPKGAQGSEANIRYVKVKLPRQLPSRLTTLQKACVAKVFEANPAQCPRASVVGHAVVHTPVVPVPLQGPAYFVSHGGAKFPELTMVLQGYGVTVDLNGETFISKKGVTSTTFHAVPDVPFESFKLTLPRGSNSALAANANLCFQTKTTRKQVRLRRNGHLVKRDGKVVEKTVKQSKTVARKLIMPTTIIGQNNKTIHQQTRIKVAGCGKTRAAHERAHGAKHKRTKHGSKHKAGKGKR